MTRKGQFDITADALMRLVDQLTGLTPLLYWRVPRRLYREQTIGQLFQLTHGPSGLFSGQHYLLVMSSSEAVIAGLRERALYLYADAFSRE